MSEITPVEIVADDQKELLAVAVQNGLLPETTQNLQASFAPLFSQARSIMDKSRGITVTSVDQKLEIDLARKCRLALKGVRVSSDKIRKELKEESLKKGKAIDGFHNILLHLVEVEETRLEEQEKFAERMEAERKAALKVQREELLKPYAIDVTVFSLGDMSQETFDQLLSGTKLAHEAKIEAARKAEAERIAREAAHAAEQARIKEENERLKREAEEREAALASERARVAEEQAKAAEIARKEREAIEAKAAQERKEAAEAARQEALRQQALREVERQKAEAEKAALELKAKQEREAREKLEAERAAAQKAVADRIVAEQNAAKKAAAAPDKEKLRAFAEELWGMKLPDLTSEGGLTILATLKTQHEKYIAWVTKQSEAL